MSLNTQHNSKPRFTWTQAEITNETIKKYRVCFSLYDDWMERYRGLKGFYPFSTEIYIGYVILTFVEVVDSKPAVLYYRINYPPTIQTFGGLMELLMAGTKGKWVDHKKSA